MPEHKSIMEVSDEQKLFVLADDEIKPNFFFFWHRHQVRMSEVWMLYRDGMLHKQLAPGPHIWFHGFFHSWRIQRINQNIELLPIEVAGRVRGPSLDREKRDGEEEEIEGIQLAGMGEFACEVKVDLGLSCGITHFETFIKYRDPLSVFLASVSNMTHEIIGNLPYDQYGHWAKLLRDEIKRRLKFTDSAENLVGMTIEDIYITNIEPNSRHDRNMLEMYQQVERARRELFEARDNKKRDKIVAESYADQGAIMNISPAILALQNSQIGKALIERDADLKKLMVAAGLNPGVNVQAIPDTQAQIGGGQSIGYLQAARRPEQLPPAHGQPSDLSSTDALAGTLPPIPNQYNTAPFSRSTTQAPPSGSSNTETPIEPVRQEQELAELTDGGFMCAGKGQFTPDYDANGQPVPGSKTWIIEVYAPRPQGYLTLVFHCPMGYPLVPPRLQMRPPSGGGLQWIEPNTIKEWKPGNMLIHVAREINDIVQD